MGGTLEVNANADGGSVNIEAPDAEGHALEGFGKPEFDGLTTDNVHQVISWQGNSDCHLRQGRPIRLRFHPKKCQAVFVYAANHAEALFAVR